MAKLNLVLVEPEIPQNTGNIARTCAATGAALHLVEPMGFRVDDKKLKRAGLDYWHLLDITYYQNLDEFFERTTGGSYFFFSTKGTHRIPRRLRLMKCCVNGIIPNYKTKASCTVTAGLTSIIFPDYCFPTAAKYSLVFLSKLP